MRLDGYIRVSRVGGRGGENFISPDVQREQIEAWAKLRGVEIAAWHTDLDQTGGKLSRPGLNTMLERIRSGATGGLVVAKLDRLSRAGVGDALKLVESVHEHGASIAAVDLGIDPTTPFGEFGMTIMLALARMERRRIGENWRIARARAIARGVHFQAAVGYDKDENGRLVPNEWAPYMQEMFRRRASGVSWRELADWLNAEGVPTTTASRWQPRTIVHTIEKRVYLGEAYHGPNRLEDAHNALVGRAEWEAANRKQPTINQGAQRLLSGGVLRCSGCLHTLKAARSQAPTRKGAPKRVYDQYRCKKDHAGGRCPEPATIISELIEPYVEQAYLDHIASQIATHEPVSDDTDVDRMKRELADAEFELDEFTADLEARRMLGKDRWRDGLRVRVEAVEAARWRLADLGVALGGVSLEPRTLVDAWREFTVHEKRRLIAQSIGLVVVRRGGRGSHTLPIDQRAAVLFRGDPRIPDGLPRRGGPGRPGTIRSFWPGDPVDAGVAATEDLAESA